MYGDRWGKLSFSDDSLSIRDLVPLHLTRTHLQVVTDCMTTTSDTNLRMFEHGTQVPGSACPALKCSVSPDPVRTDFIILAVNSCTFGASSSIYK